MKEDIKDVYDFFGLYSSSTAKLILDAFVKNEINFDINIDDSRIKNMTPLQAAYGGTFGQGAGIAISVSSDDLDEARRIQQQVLKIE